MNVAVVIAAYDEQENIGPLTLRLIQTLDSIPVAWSLTYVIEGRDGTVEIARRFAADRPEILVLYNRAPTGLGRAFRLGFEAIPQDADLVITMDADLNHQPEEIPFLIDSVRTYDADIVVGSRRLTQSQTEGAPLWKTVTSVIIGFVMRTIFKVAVKDMTSGYRVYRAACLRKIHFQNDDFAFLPEILIEAAAMQAIMVEHPIHFIFRKSGVSKMNVWTTARSYVRLFGLCIVRRARLSRPPLETLPSQRKQVRDPPTAVDRKSSLGKSQGS